MYLKMVESDRSRLDVGMSCCFSSMTAAVLHGVACLRRHHAQAASAGKEELDKARCLSYTQVLVLQLCSNAAQLGQSFS